MRTTWWAALLPLLRGVALGLAISFGIAQLPESAQPWALSLLLVGAMAFCFWMLHDLRRMRRQTLEHLEQLERQWDAQ